MHRLAWAAVGLVLVATPVVAQNRAIAVLRALDKVTARVSTIEAPVGREVRFGTLRILVRSCAKRPPEETPETSMFIEILDLRPRGAPQRVFTGWMFASSPALSAMEHPTYDVWPIDCRAAAPPSSDNE
ncbi:MAG: DUF2155 domain-containing protein [Proteobacteria bacterium]|nr:DUF2155 domain-containing protein [Pseudomonadota bacterium]MDA1058184.1 DUF2155 domain-containing protein [Pseudomonadota bacterium]